MGNESELMQLFALFFDGTPVSFETIDSSRGDDDLRVAFIAETDAGERYVIKLADNDFTFPGKIKMWQRTVSEYRALGYYCPKIFPDKQGEFPVVQYNGHRYIAFAEEYSAYKPISSRDNGSEALSRRYHTDIWIMTGKVAAKHFDYTDYPSAYCLFETFCPSDETEEVLENALKWKEYADTLPETFRSQTDRIWKLWNDNRTALEKIYHKLPTSVFQADLNSTNLLADEDGRFVGVLDFNLCGKDVFLNYLIRENYGSFEHDMETIPAALRAAAKVYKFSDSDKDAVLMLYRCLSTLWVTKLEELKGLGEDREAVKAFLDKTEHYLTSDTDFVQYMA